MKRFYLLLAAATLLAAIAGCQKEPAGNENAESAKAYAQLNISFADPSGTKADPTADDGTGFDAGTEDEYAIKTATLYFVKNVSGTMTVVKKHTVTGDFTKKVLANKDVVYTSEINGLTVGDYNVYVTVNCVLGVTENVTTEAQLQALQQGTSGTIPGTDLTNGIPMTSRDVNANQGANAANAGLYDVISVTSNNTKDNPCIIELSMERVWAKIAYTPNSTTSPATPNNFKINADRGTGAEIATVELTHYKVNNQTSLWNAFRQSCTLTDGLAATATGFGKFSTTDYVYEPTTTAKTVAAVDSYTGLTDPATFSSLPSIAGALAYTYENGLHKNSQLVGYVTTVQFKGLLKPTTVYEKTGDETVAAFSYTPGTTVYFYEDTFYKDLDAVNAGAKLGLADDSQAKKFNVKIYENGVCYYNYYIRHWNNGNDQETGIMEYAIVRNNSYDIKVTNILTPGDDDQVEGIPTANTPVEQIDSYFQVQLTIRPWVVRAQEAVLG